MEYEKVVQYVKDYGIYFKTSNTWKLNLNSGYYIKYQALENEEMLFISNGLIKGVLIDIYLQSFKLDLLKYTNIYDVIDYHLGIKPDNSNIEKFMWGR